MTTRRDGGATIVRVDGVIHRVRTSRRLVALTFDDGDDPTSWSALLERLDETATRASFFPSGMRVEEHPHLARRTIAAGHTVGSHGYDHSRMTDSSPEQLRRAFRRDRRAWGATTGTEPTLFRPPFGAWDARTWDVAREAGFRGLVLWDVDPEDWRRRPADEVAHAVLGGARPGSIVLLHVVPETAAALPAILSGLKRRSLACAPLSRLLAMGAGRGPTAQRRPTSSSQPPP